MPVPPLPGERGTEGVRACPACAPVALDQVEYDGDVIRLGWGVFRAQVWQVVDRRRVRGSGLVAAVVAVIVVAGLTALQLTVGWTGAGPVRTVIAIALLGLASALLVVGCWRTALPVDPAATINGRTVRPDWQLAVRWSVQPYLARTMPPINPDDRAAILADTPLLQRGLVRRLVRAAPLFGALGLAGAAVVTAGVVTGFAVPWAFLYLVTLPDMLVRLGRAERARLAALALPDTAVADAAVPPADRRREPTGSKVRLPGE
ncbi:hypothetical protein [Curtobacterium sp. ISL-83]|uniref:hypothetical protein n=1 Tax=Curtobacterium sp. ISL-83 TaxID=2819145 RepID=UPI001BE6F582|nr:hypothetical protein [Curtobacterium sp. ISL-83]MBT2502728.1 hypothetical protein [Curtobacterium sp. ISL-83]